MDGFWFQDESRKDKCVIYSRQKGVEQALKKKKKKKMSNSILHLNALTLYAQQQEPLQKA